MAVLCCCHCPSGNGQRGNNYGFWGPKELSGSSGHRGWDILTSTKGFGLPFSNWGLGYFTGDLDGTDPYFYSYLRGLGPAGAPYSWVRPEGNLACGEKLAGATAACPLPPRRYFPMDTAPIFQIRCIFLFHISNKNHESFQVPSDFQILPGG